MTNRELYSKCVKFGRQALKARRKFIGLLPEVARRGLWRKKGYGSIYVFAYKLAGLSMRQVEEALRLERRLQDKPALHQALISGEIGVSKLTRVASIATKENDAELVTRAKVLSKAAIETYIRDLKVLPGQTLELKEEICQPGPSLDEDVKKELNDLQRKGIDINQELREFFKQRKERLEAEKAKVKTNTKQISASVRRYIINEKGARCAKCGQKARQIHHVKHRSKGGTHDPGNLIPLCKEHHALEHIKERQRLWSG